jgi:hypothetical protein
MTHPCQQCKFYVPGRYARTGTCTRYIAYRGRGKLVYEFADNARLEASKCGPSGRLFVSKNTPVQKNESILLHLLNDDE